MGTRAVHGPVTGSSCWFGNELSASTEVRYILLSELILTSQGLWPLETISYQLHSKLGGLFTDTAPYLPNCSARLVSLVATIFRLAGWTSKAIYWQHCKLGVNPLGRNTRAPKGVLLQRLGDPYPPPPHSLGASVVMYQIKIGTVDSADGPAA